MHDTVGGWDTLRKYRLGVPSARMTDTLAVLVQADTPQESAEITLVPFGRTEKWGGSERIVLVVFQNEAYLQRRPC